MPQGKEIIKVMIEKELFFKCYREFGQATLDISDNRHGKNK